MATIKKGQGKFYVGESEAEPLAEITFSSLDETKLVIEHTVVSEELSGQGIGGKLVEKVVNLARDEGKKIVSECSYAKSKIEKTPEFQDVLVPEKN